MNSPAVIEHTQSIDISSDDFVGILSAKLDKQLAESVRRKRDIHSRWVDDLRQYNGLYDTRTEQNLQNTPGAKIFVNITRPKTDAGEAQLADLLLPHDDDNWGLEPTPSPQLKRREQSDIAHFGGQPIVDDETGDPVTRKTIQQAERDQALEASKAMSTLIADQQAESDYTGNFRKMIHDASLLGTGIICGPCPLPGGQVGVRHVSPWNLFPDMDAVSIDDCEFIFERVYMNRRTMRKFCSPSNKMIRQEAADEVLRNGAQGSRIYSDEFSRERIRRETTVGHMTDANGSDKGRYEVYVWTGELESEELQQAGVDVPPEFENRIGVPVQIWMCSGLILQIVPVAHESLFMTYRVMNWAKDEGCIFGFGIPFQMANSQRIINTAWRMTLNAGSKNAGVQAVFDKLGIEPEDGVWEIAPDKIWLKTNPQIPAANMVHFFQPGADLNSIMAIYNLARKFVDEETGLPIIGQGEQGETTKTYGGMSLLVNAASVVRRRQVKQVDDEVIKPMIQSFFEFNNAFSDDVSVKGDMRAVARGVSMLVAREQQVQAMMQVAQSFSAHPIYGPMIEHENLLRDIIKGMGLSDNRTMKSHEQIVDDEKAQAEAEPPIDPVKQAELDLQGRKIEQGDRSLDLKEKQIDNDYAVNLNTLATNERVSDKSHAQRDAVAMKQEAASNYRFNKELRVKEVTGRGI